MKNEGRNAPVAENDILLDTSAVIAMLSDEDGADVVEHYLAAAEKGSLRIYCSFATMAEVHSITLRKAGHQKALLCHALVRSWPITWIDSSEKLCLESARLKAANKLSFSDSFIAATALLCDATLVHKDPEFEALLDSVRQRILPYKLPKRG
ncbi:MAG: VapC toxin family PIN domain ribonuclease [Verrucomicrobia bacterium]|nr:VapC toxin family PIN domain ribonuclease [Verrucomicrobiota bacterium]